MDSHTETSGARDKLGGSQGTSATFPDLAEAVGDLFSHKEDFLLLFLNKFRLKFLPDS